MQDITHIHTHVITVRSLTILVWRWSKNLHISAATHWVTTVTALCPFKPFSVQDGHSFLSLIWDQIKPLRAPSSFLSVCQRHTKLHFLPSYEGCNLYWTLDLLTYNSQFGMRSCVCLCVWGRTHEIVSVSLWGCIHQCCQHSYGQAFSGSMFSSELINLAPHDYVCGYLCGSARSPPARKTTMTNKEASFINHLLSTEPH